MTFNLVLQLTRACNMRCRYCYSPQKAPDSMSLRCARQAIDLALDQVPRHGKLRVGFFGGEPALEFRAIRELTASLWHSALAREIDLELALTTNGTLLDGDRLAFLRRNRFELAVSIDGTQKAHDRNRVLADGRGSYATIAQSFPDILEHFPGVRAAMVVDPTNVTDLAAGLSDLYDHGFRVFETTPNYHAHWAEEDATALEAAYREVGRFYVDRLSSGEAVEIAFIDTKVAAALQGGFRRDQKCGFGWREIAVAPSGHIYPCERVIHNDDGKMALGDVHKGFSKDARRYYKQHCGNVNKACKKCAVAPRCANWCACVNYARTGRIDRCDGFVCFYERLAIEVADQCAATMCEVDPEFMNRRFGQPAAVA